MIRMIRITDHTHITRSARSWVPKRQYIRNQNWQQRQVADCPIDLLGMVIFLQSFIITDRWLNHLLWWNNKYNSPWEYHVSPLSLSSVSGKANRSRNKYYDICSLSSLQTKICRTLFQFESTRRWDVYHMLHIGKRFICDSVCGFFSHCVAKLCFDIVRNTP